MCELNPAIWETIAGTGDSGEIHFLEVSGIEIWFARDNLSVEISTKNIHKKFYEQ
jgi:hypothetical protein